MDLFEKKGRKLRRRLHLLFPAVLLVIICTIFFLGIGRAGTQALQKEQETLEKALMHGAIHTYALTGSYPESLQHLLDEYAIQYDRDRFVVEYIPNGSNLLPTINVISLTGGGSS